MSHFWLYYVIDDRQKTRSRMCTLCIVNGGTDKTRTPWSRSRGWFTSATNPRQLFVTSIACMSFNVIVCITHTGDTLVFFPDDDDCIGDVLFALDSSGSVTGYNWIVILQFVIDVIKGLKISNTETRVGVIIFSTEVETCFQLNEYFTIEDLEREVFSCRYMAGATNIADALKRIREVFNATGRPDTAWIGVLTTDGHDNIDYARTIPEANLTKHDVDMFVVGKLTHTHTHARTHARTHTPTRIYRTCIRMHTHTHTQERTHARSHTRTQAHTRARTHAPTQAYTRARTLARTHIHTPKISRPTNIVHAWHAFDVRPSQ